VEGLSFWYHVLRHAEQRRLGDEFCHKEYWRGRVGVPDAVSYLPGCWCKSYHPNTSHVHVCRIVHDCSTNTQPHRISPPSPSPASNPPLTKTKPPAAKPSKQLTISSQSPPKSTVPTPPIPPNPSSSQKRTSRAMKSLATCSATLWFGTLGMRRRRAWRILDPRMAGRR
jgi:hypothetical protein